MSLIPRVTLYTSNLQHTTELHTTLRLCSVLARLCASSVWVTFVTTLVRLQCSLPQCCPNVGIIVPLLGQQWGNLNCCLSANCTQPSQHTTEPLCLCAARWCAARSCRLCVIRFDCVEGSPVYTAVLFSVHINQRIYLFPGTRLHGWSGEDWVQNHSCVHVLQLDNISDLASL